MDRYINSQFLKLIIFFGKHRKCDLGLASFKVPPTLLCVWEDMNIKAIVPFPDNHLKKKKMKIALEV